MIVVPETAGVHRGGRGRLCRVVPRSVCDVIFLCNRSRFTPPRSELAMRVALLLFALCAAANGLQAGFRPLPATVATVTARTPVVLAQENSPFAKLADVPAPALAATFTGTGLVVVVRVTLLERTVCACLLPRPACSAAGGAGVFNSRPAGCRTLCSRRHRPAEAGPGLAGRGMSLPRAQRPALHPRVECCVISKELPNL